jgi:hypothetical protein
MSGKVGLAVKKPGNKERDTVSNKPKPDFSQSVAVNSPMEQVLQLQRTIGNQAVTRLIQSGAIQAKLKIGQPEDMYEQEADRVAEQIMRMSEGSLARKESESGCPECFEEVNSPMIQRQIEEEEEEELVQTKSAPGSTSQVNADIESRIQSMSGGGQPLSESTRAFFEPRFGVDFSQVRVHQDAESGDISASLGARAFTLGKDIRMGRGESTSDKRLMAHELTHVVQQGYRTSVVQKQQTAPACPATCHATAAGAAADVDAHVVPANCFVWQVGTAQCPRGCGRWQAMPGTGCAHWVAHQMGISSGLTCNAGRSVRVGSVVAGRTSYPLAQAQVGDIWTNAGLSHTGIVRQVRTNTATPPAVTSAEVEHDSSAQGGVVRTWFTSGSFWR